jgi:FkbM family methyltransferase
MELFLYNSPAFHDFLKSNPHERGEVKFLESIAEEGMNAIDIGGHIGVTTVVIAKQVGKRGLVYSFEPVPEYFDILKKNLSANKLENVEAFQLAVTDRLETIDFYQQGGFSGIIPEEGTNKFQANTTTIDRFLNERKAERIDLINMDCQGSELLVLEGAKESLRKNRVKIFYEIHHASLKRLGQSVQHVVQYLQGLGYEVHSVSLDDLSMRSDFGNAEYIYAHN